jgi:hypothetical protein
VQDDIIVLGPSQRIRFDPARLAVVVQVHALRLAAANRMISNRPEL